MFLSLRELELRTLRFEETYPPGEIQFPGGEARQASPIRAVGSAELLPNTGGEIRIRGRLSVRMETECDRCLEAASFPVELDFDLFYEPVAPKPRAEEVEIDAGEVDVAFYKGEGLELEEVLREQILLALPMRRICREDCRGICPICGENRNRVLCTCQPEMVDDRWAALRRL